MFCISNSAGIAGLIAGGLVLNGCAHHYHAVGTVLDMNNSGRSVTISHRSIPGYMPAMAMQFPVAHPEQLRPLTPGARVRFDIAVRNRSARITNLRVDAGPAPEFTIPKPRHKVAVGELLPDFVLLDEQNRPVRLSDFRGRVTAIQFIYTRCPLPDVCPRLSANFAYLQKRFARQITLLSITIDPDHDTPEVLRDYARRWRADPATWHFLSGAADDIRRVADTFGLFYFAEEGSITHTSTTAVIAPDGRVSAMLEGSGYTVQELADVVGVNIARRSQR